METIQVKISSDQLGSYRDEREFDMSVKTQRRLSLSGYSSNQDHQRVRPRYLSRSDVFILNAF